MAIGAYKSTLLAGTGRKYSNDRMAKIRLVHFEVAAPAVAGDAGSHADLVELPYGRIRILPHLSLVWGGAFGADRVLKVGHRAYEKEGSVTEAEDDDALGSNVDISAATVGVKIGTARKFDIFSRKGVTIFGTVTGGTWPTNTGTLEGYIAYSAD